MTEMIKSINPATLEVNREITANSPDEIPGLVTAAREAQKDWAAIGVEGRLEYMKKVRSWLVRNIDEVARVITLDNGKTLLESLNAEIYSSLDMLSFLIKDAAEILGAEKISNPIFQIARIKSENIFQPLGVVGIISPWNFPFAIPFTQSLMALTAGNAVIFKPAELTAYVGELIGDIFKKAGLPDGVFTVIQGSGAVLGEAMMDARLDKIAFTGSVPVGRHIMRRAAETLTPINLELGGKDPMIILEDADIERASSGAVWGAFLNAGQVCASVERVYVAEKIADRFIEAVVEKTKKLRVGNGLGHDVDMGPMINEKQLRLVESHIADACAKGARIAAGGKRREDLAGWFFEPTVITGADHSMDCVMEETFGPTMPVMRFSSVDEAVRLANDSRFGLTASVWSKDAARARAVAEKIVTGTVVINDCILTYGFAQCPWGGVRESGIGRTHSAHGLIEFTSIKNITTSASPFREDVWWHPYSENKYIAMKALSQTIFCDGVLCRATGMAEAVRMLRRSTGRDEIDK